MKRDEVKKFPSNAENTFRGVKKVPKRKEETIHGFSGKLEISR